MKDSAITKGDYTEGSKIGDVVNKICTVSIIMVAILVSFYLNSLLAKYVIKPLILNVTSETYLLKDMKATSEEYIFGMGSGYFEIKPEKIYKKVYIEFDGKAEENNEYLRKTKDGEYYMFILESDLKDFKTNKHNAYQRADINFYLIFIFSIVLIITLVNLSFNLVGIVWVTIGVIFIPFATVVIFSFIFIDKEPRFLTVNIEQTIEETSSK